MNHPDIRERAREKLRDAYNKHLPLLYLEELEAVIDEVVLETQQATIEKCLEALPEAIDPKRFGYPLDRTDIRDIGWNDYHIQARAALQAVPLSDLT